MDRNLPVLSSDEHIEAYYEGTSIEEFETDEKIEETDEENKDFEDFQGLVFTNKRMILFRENDITDVLYSKIWSMSLRYKEESVSVDTGLRYFVGGISTAIVWSLIVSLTSLSSVFSSIPKLYLYFPGLLIALLLSGIGTYVFFSENEKKMERYEFIVRTNQQDPIELTIETEQNLETTLMPLLRSKDVAKE